MTIKVRRYVYGVVAKNLKGKKSKKKKKKKKNKGHKGGENILVKDMLM